MHACVNRGTRSLFDGLGLSIAAKNCYNNRHCHDQCSNKCESKYVKYEQTFLLENMEKKPDKVL